MKPRHLPAVTLGALGLVLPAAADVIYSNLQEIAIPATFDGLYLNVETGAWNTNMAAPEAGWDINPFYGGRAVANSPDFQPVRSGTGSDSPILDLSTGTMSFATGQSWDSFSHDWEINDFTGTSPGTDFDRIDVTGSLTLSLLGSYQLNLLSLDALDAPGDVPDFSEISRSWNLVTTTGGISNFDASKWSINAMGFTNNETGTWALAESGGSIVLSYIPVPEPRAALLGGIGILLLLRRRR